MATQAIPPPHPSGDFWSRACEFSGKLAGFQTRWLVSVTNPQAKVLGGDPQGIQNLPIP